MANDDTRWDNQAAVDAKLNALGFFAYTNLAAFPATDMEIGAKGIAEDTGIIYQNQGTYATPSWVAISASGGQEGDMLYPLNKTIGDHSIPSAAVSSSDGVALEDVDIFDTSGATINSGINVGTGADGTRCGNRLQSGHVSIGTTVNYVEMNIKKVGSPTGTWKVVIRRISDDVIVSTVNFDPAAQSTSNTLVQFTFDVPRVIVAGDRVMLESAGGSASDYITVNGSTTHTTGLDRTFYTGSYSDSTSVTMLMVANGDIPSSADNAINDDTGVPWTSQSEATPSIYFNMAATKELVGIAINLNRTLTDVTTLYIDYSIDTTFSGEQVRAILVTDFTDDTWRFIMIPRQVDDRQYFRITTPDTGILSINEVKYISQNDAAWARVPHYHKYLNPTDTDANSKDSN